MGGRRSQVSARYVCLENLEGNTNGRFSQIYGRGVRKRRVDRVGDKNGRNSFIYRLAIIDRQKKGEVTFAFYLIHIHIIYFCQ